MKRGREMRGKWRWSGGEVGKKKGKGGTSERKEKGEGRDGVGVYKSTKRGTTSTPGDQRTKRKNSANRGGQDLA